MLLLAQRGSESTGIDKSPSGAEVARKSVLLLLRLLLVLVDADTGLGG